MFAINELSRPHSADEVVEHHGDTIASVLRGERATLSRQERDEILRHRISYLANDLVIPTWNAAFVYDTPAGADAALEIVEFANSQLLQFRYYDDLLDTALTSIYANVQKEARWYDAFLGRHYARAARQVHALFIDVNELTDRTENALKIVGDVYAARLFSLVGARLDLDRWKTNVREKLKTLDDIYRFAVEHLSMVRGEVLEMTIVGHPRVRARAVLHGNHGITMNDVLAIVLGGGQGSRLFPLTHQRSKPAVPIGGKYRLIDVPISNCLHADLRRIFVLTQFNSAVAEPSCRADLSHGSRSRTGSSTSSRPSRRRTARAGFRAPPTRCGRRPRHFRRYAADYYLILAGDHLYRMDYGRLLDAHVDQDADITVAALPVTPDDAPGMGIFLFDREGQIVGFEEKPSSERLAAIGTSVPPGTLFRNQTYTDEKPFVASMGIYVFTRDVLLDLLQNTTVTDFGREIIPAALNTHRVRAYLHDDYWADVGTIESFYDANIMLTEPHAPFKFYDPRRPTFTHERFLPPSQMRSCAVRESIVAEGCFLDECSIERSVIGIRTHISRGTRITRSVLLGADMYADGSQLGHRTRRRARSRHHRQERVDRRRRAAAEPVRRAARRRRRLLHPWRHRHRAEGRKDCGRHDRVAPSTPVETTTRTRNRNAELGTRPRRFAQSESARWVHR